MSLMTENLYLTDGAQLVSSLTCWTFGKPHCQQLAVNAVLTRHYGKGAPVQVTPSSFESGRQLAVDHYIEVCCP